MIVTLIASAASAVVSSVISVIATRYYFPRIVEKIVEVEKAVEKIIYIEKPTRPEPARPRLLSMEERRELIASRANDPEVRAQVIESIQRRDKASGLLARDFEAQVNPNWGRKLEQ